MHHQANHYKYLFFDLDRTLWDLETNSRITLELLHSKHNLEQHASVADFTQAYHKHNNRLWAEYGAGNIKKEQLRKMRFYLTLKQFKVKDFELSDQLDADYVQIAPTQTTLFPHTLQLLEKLQEKGYRMYILTNGFVDTQWVKLRSSGIDGYFKQVYFSESIGSAKPSPAYFQHVLDDLNALPSECLMIGDDWESDIMGAARMGIDQVFFNPNKVQVSGIPTYQVTSMLEVEEILNN